MHAGSYFDIGSITKSVVTGSLFALAVDQGKAALSDTVAKWIPEWRSNAIGKIELGSLLCHASGLKDWLPLYETDFAKVGIRSWLGKRASEWVVAPPDTTTSYSDLGFLVLGEAIKEIWNQDLGVCYRERVQQPLGLTEVVYPKLPAKAEVVATEVRASLPLVGVPFDENSSALGGVTPHAGLFATARGLGYWAREWLAAVEGQSKWLGQATAQTFVKRASRVSGSSWALGWDTKSEKGSSAGNLFSSASFGHLGYPGASVWIDPKSGGIAVFSTNRVHPSRLDERIRRIRPQLHDLIAAEWANK